MPYYPSLKSKAAPDRSSCLSAPTYPSLRSQKATLRSGLVRHLFVTLLYFRFTHRGLGCGLAQSWEVPNGVASSWCGRI
jgi:hypothetical protein